MHYIKPTNEQDRPKFLYIVATSGNAVGVSGDGIFRVPDSVINLLNEKQLKFIDVSDLKKPVNPS